MGNSREAKNLVTDWTALLAESRAESMEVPGPEWKTTRQIAEDQGLSVSYTSTVIRELTRAGKVEIKKFMVATESKAYPVPHYKIKK